MGNNKLCMFLVYLWIILATLKKNKLKIESCPDSNVLLQDLILEIKYLLTFNLLSQWISRSQGGKTISL